MGVLIWGAQAVVSATSLVLGRPWTALPARRSYPPHVRAHPVFHDVNMSLTRWWTLYFGVAALVSALGPGWVAGVAAVPTPFLGWLSFRVGERRSRALVGGREGEGSAVMLTDRQRELRQLVEGRSDDELVALVEQGGVDEVLDQTFEGMGEALDPAAAQDSVFAYEVMLGDDVFCYRVEVSGEKVDAHRGESGDARTVLRLSVPDYLRLITGLLDGTQAFMSGKMQIRGDLMFATQIGRMFRTA